MSEISVREPDFESLSQIRILAEQVFSRTACAPLERGNSVRILKDAKENYPAWIEAISRARAYVHFESYIIHDDDVGAELRGFAYAESPGGNPGQGAL